MTQLFPPLGKSAGATARPSAPPTSWHTADRQGWQCALEIITSAERHAKAHEMIESLILYHLEKSDLFMDAGQVENALDAVLEAQGLVMCHPELPVSLQVVVRVRLARLYGQREDRAQVSNRLLLLANRHLMGQFQQDFFALAMKCHQLSQRDVSLMNWQQALSSARQALDVLQQLPEGKRYDGHPLSFWRARFRLRCLWIRVAEQVALGHDSDLATSIDDEYWSLLPDPDVALWSKAPELAFHLEYVGTWLGYEVLGPNAARFEGWRRQLWWAALRRPPGQTPLKLPIGLRFHSIPATVKQTPLIQALLERVKERLDAGGPHDRAQ